MPVEVLPDALLPEALFPDVEGVVAGVLVGAEPPVLAVDVSLDNVGMALDVVVTSIASTCTQYPWAFAFLRPMGPIPTVCGPGVNPDTV